MRQWTRPLLVQINLSDILIEIQEFQSRKCIWTYRLRNDGHFDPCLILLHGDPNSKVHGAYMGPIWGRQDPGGPHVGPMDFAIWENPQNEIKILHPKMGVWYGLLPESLS